MRRQQSRVVDSGSTDRSGRRIACMQCRQAKIRCELSKGATGPCSRCLRLDQDCKINTEFKRVNKRARLDELETEVQQLRSSLPNRLSSTSRPMHDTSPASRSVNHDPSTASCRLPWQRVQNEPLDHLPASSDQIEFTAPDRVLPSCARSLKHINLSCQQIDSLFYLFFKHYHPNAPLLDPDISPDSYYLRSPLLFWIIIYTACRRYTDEPSLLTALTLPMRTLVWETISSPPHTWYTVQAISLLCMWPFPTSSLSTDTTPMLVSIMQTIAMQLGLHEPESIQDFSRTKRKLSSLELSEVAKTWSLCYIASQSISTVFGLAFASSDGIIDRLCHQDSCYSVPNIMKQQLFIYRFSARVSTFMSRIYFDDPRLLGSHDNGPVLALLEQEFVDLSRSISGLTGENEIILSGVGLQLYVFYLLDPSNSIARKMGLLRAYDMATTLVTKIQQLDTTHNFIKYCPASYFRAASLSALFILKLQDSNYATLLDSEGGRRAFTAALSLLRRASLEDNDIPDRTSNILSQLWSQQGRSQQSGKEPTLRLRTRMAASLLHDQLWTWRETFGGQGSASHTPLPDSSGHQPAGSSFEDDTAADVALGDNGMESFVYDEVFGVDILPLLPFGLESSLPFDVPPPVSHDPNSFSNQS